MAPAGQQMELHVQLWYSTRHVEDAAQVGSKLAGQANGLDLMILLHSCPTGG